MIPLLYLVQDQMKRQTGSAWVPTAGMDEVARRLDMAPIRVYEVATFYFMFNLRPIGKWHLQVCTTTPCWLRGSDEVVAACRAATGIKGWGETSADGEFTMTEVECVGALRECAGHPGERRLLRGPRCGQRDGSCWRHCVAANRRSPVRQQVGRPPRRMAGRPL